MLFNVPQFIDVEDKIVGPLTAKQLGWLALGGVLLLVLWNFLDVSAFFLAAIIIGIIVCALAFYRPYNQPLISFIFSSITFALNPKMYVWKRQIETEKAAKHIRPKETIIIPTKKQADIKRIEEVSKVLNQEK